MVVHLEAVQEDEAVSDKAGGVAVVSQADNSGDDSPPPPVTPVSVVPVLAKAAIAQDAHHDSDGEMSQFHFRIVSQSHSPKENFVQYNI